jgi:hypothetical protein
MSKVFLAALLLLQMNCELSCIVANCPEHGQPKHAGCHESPPAGESESKDCGHEQLEDDASLVAKKAVSQPQFIRDIRIPAVERPFLQRGSVNAVHHSFTLTFPDQSSSPLRI